MGVLHCLFNVEAWVETLRPGSFKGAISIFSLLFIELLVDGISGSLNSFFLFRVRGLSCFLWIYVKSTGGF